MELFAWLIVPVLLSVAVPHELGHLLVARAFGVTVLEFGLGLPPRAWSWRWQGITWSINWLLPFGAFVKLKGEHQGDAPDDFAARAPWQRALVVLAGPGMNLLVAAIAVALSLLVVGRPSLPASVVATDVPMVGWVGLAQVMQELAGAGISPLAWYLALLAALSLGLGLTNLLPLPPLDGSRVLLSVAEAIHTRPLASARVLARLNWAGFALLLLLFAAVTAGDVLRLAQGQAVLVQLQPGLPPA